VCFQFQNFTTRIKSHEEDFIRSLLRDLQRGDIRVQDAVEFADTVIFKPKLKEKHERVCVSFSTVGNWKRTHIAMSF
jgi:uncharacterized protein YciW